jgi:hypothetical protein
VIRCLAAVSCAAILVANAQSHEDVNSANNPLTAKVGWSVQDQWGAKLYDTDEDTNAVLLRATVPHKLFGKGQIFRATLPVVTAPDPTGGGKTGVGDLNLLDIVPFLAGGIELGIGPQLTVPTASDDLLGKGKWQAGVAGVIVAPQKWGLAGALVTWQHSFAGASDRPTQSGVVVQPVLIYNLPDGWYLRSSATWNFDLAHDVYAIPVGAGLGRVVVLADKTTINAFIEPQWTVAHDGAGQPKFQVYAGITVQLP